MEYTIGELQPALVCCVNIYYDKVDTNKNSEKVEVALLPNGYLVSKYSFKDTTMREEICSAIKNHFSDNPTKSDKVLIKKYEYKLILYNWKQSFTCTATIKMDNTIMKAQITEMESGFIFISIYNYKQNQVAAEILKDIKSSLIRKYKEEKNAVLKKTSPQFDNNTPRLLAVEYSPDPYEKGKYHAESYFEGNINRHFLLTYNGERMLNVLELTSDSKTITLNNRGLFEQVRDDFFNKHLLDELFVYSKINEDSAEETKYGRRKNAKAANILCYRENQSLLEEHILSNKKRKIFSLSALKNVTSFEVEILSWINILRYVTSDIITDLFSARLISAEKVNYSKNFLSQKMSFINRFGLVDISRFVTLDDAGDIIDNPNTQSIARVYTLGEHGASMLAELGRSYYYNAFERFQNGNIVKAILASNQWLVYWLFSYPKHLKISIKQAELSIYVVHNRAVQEFTHLLSAKIMKELKLL